MINTPVEVLIKSKKGLGEMKRKPKNFITEEEIEVINAKRYLTLKEAAVLLNVTTLTLRIWTLAGKMNSHKIGKQWIFDVNSIENYIV
jgi:excisionase family DNA binding protein